MSLRSLKLTVSAEAESDLADILQYTLDEWGARKMNAYAARLNEGLRLIALQPLLGKAREDLFPGCRCHQIEEHMVWYEVAGDDLRIARFLHKRMNVRLHF